MNGELTARKHLLQLENRESLTVTGIKDVDAFNDEEITAAGDCGDIVIKGESLRIEELNLESGLLKVKGKIRAIVYNDKLIKKGMLKRMFSQ
ncbi:MAG: sporulation protein YabP [Eubacterium sp.]|nr:sporulation protein YabP [Eubacterium sp.]